MNPMFEEGQMLIDCERCEVRGDACSDCVVTVLLGGAPAADDVVELNDEERAAIGVLAGSGLVPPLRLVLPVERDVGHVCPGGDDARPRRRAAG
jgi:hypothetical protein